LIEVLQKDYRTDFLVNSNIFEPELLGAMNFKQKVTSKADMPPKKLRNVSGNGVINPDLLKNIEKRETQNRDHAKREDEGFVERVEVEKPGKTGSTGGKVNKKTEVAAKGNTKISSFFGKK